jgi:hypothetical protein
VDRVGQGGFILAVHARVNVGYRGGEVERGHARVVGLSTLGDWMGTEAEQSSVDMRLTD